MGDQNKNERRWEHSSGRNGPHKRPCPKAALEARLLGIDLKIAAIQESPYPHCKRKKLALQKERRHVRQLIDETGEEHARIAKGFRAPSLR